MFGHGIIRAIEKWNAELAFRPSSRPPRTRPGSTFMRHLVKNSRSRSTSSTPSSPSSRAIRARVKTIAYWSRGDWQPNVEFALSALPCERVDRGRLLPLQRRWRRELFPADTALAELGIRSYLGVPLRSADGRTLGHLAALDTRPMDDDPRGMTIFQVFANRARVEIERCTRSWCWVRAVRDLEGRLASTRVRILAVDAARASTSPITSSRRCSRSTCRPASHLRRPDLFSELARSVKPLLPAASASGSSADRPGVPACPRVGARPAGARPDDRGVPVGGHGLPLGAGNRSATWPIHAKTCATPFPMTHRVMEREGWSRCARCRSCARKRASARSSSCRRSAVAYREVPDRLIDRVASAVAVAVDHCFAYEELAHCAIACARRTPTSRRRSRRATTSRDRRAQPGALEGALARRDRSPDAFDGADPRRDGHRQGAGRARDPRRSRRRDGRS
jgi:hypothetical protein